MKGHIRERSPGHWAIVLDVHEPETGQRRRKWHSFRGTKRQAESECARLVAAQDLGTYVEPKKTSVRQFLETWLLSVRSQVSPRTYERYEEIVRKNIIPLLGDVTLSKLRPEQISAAYAKALSHGRRDGSGGLSPRTVGHMHRVLRQAVRQAVAWGNLVRDPVAAVKPPKVERTKMRALNPEETVRLLDHFRPTRMYVPVLLAVLCGLRRGEIAALRWRAVDLEAAQLSVVASTEQTRDGVREKEPKSRRSRTVALPSFAVEELTKHRTRQREEQLRLGMRADGDGYVVAQPDGKPLQPNSLTHEFVRILSLCRDLPVIRFHDLRHTHATHLLAEGVHPKVAQERLGHSSVGITLDLYSHVLPGMQADAAAKVDVALRRALDRRG